MLTGRHPVRVGIKEVKVALVGEGLGADEVTLRLDPFRTPEWLDGLHLGPQLHPELLHPPQVDTGRSREALPVHFLPGRRRGSGHAAPQARIRYAREGIHEKERYYS